MGVATSHEPAPPPARSMRRAVVLDAAIAGFAAVAAVTLTTELLGGRRDAAVVAAYAVAAAHGGSVVLRRVAPRAMVATLLVTAALYTLVIGLPVFMLGPAVLFAAYGIGAFLPRRHGLPLLALVEVALLGLLVRGESFPGWASSVFFAGLVGASWSLGDVVRRWQTLAIEHEQRATELAQARLDLARHEVTAERVRIARELHDVVAHSMSVIAMHAGAARLAVGRDTTNELEALNIIEETSRDAMAELRRLVTVLRDSDSGALAPVREPAPGLADLHDLVARVAAAGITVDVVTDGDLERVPPGPSLSAYRVIQEALTNVVRHAGPTSARLSVRVSAGDVVMCVEDQGPASGSRSTTVRGGHGVVGMRERAELYGGSLTSGPTGLGGWRVEARIPFRLDTA